MNVGQKILSDITVYMKYARYLPELNRRENWDELIDRNVAMHKEKYPMIQDEIDANYEFVRGKKVLPSMRSLQFAGKPIEISPNRVFNCAFLPIDDWRSFSETMFLLLGGTGVGYSVQYHHVAKLPDITKPREDRSRRYLIGDSIEGWSDAIKVLMKSYFFGGSKIKFDFSDIRPKGARLVTSGGKAPGPQPLRECLVKIEGILSTKENGDKLTPIEVHDIICHIADAVLAGGIRRAALISLFSATDEEMLAAKSGNWWELNPQRGRANNSAVLMRHRITKEFFLDLWRKIEASGAGEPGIYLSNDKDWGTNPCCEIALRPFQFCVSGDTKLITKDGIHNIEDVVGTDVEIWNGDQWSEVIPYKTGDSDRLYRVQFSDGSYLDATDGHKFLVKHRFQKEFNEVTTLELIELLKTSKYALQIPRSNIEYKGGVEFDDAYDAGYVLGDGCVYSGRVYADLYADVDVLELGGAKYKSCKNYNGTEYTRMTFDHLDTSFVSELKYAKGLPSRIFTWDRDSILQFIAGWADADGSNASKGIRIYGREDKIRDGQLLLSKCGIDSSVNLMQEAGVETNFGVRKNSVWYLQITKTVDIPSQRLICDNVDGAKFKGKYQIVKDIEMLDGFHKSYCLTEHQNHQCVFNNVLTKQCNLSEVNVSDVESQEDLNDRVRAASFIGTLQAGYTDFHYLRPVWQRTTEKDALIGVSMTGIGSNRVADLDLKEASSIAVAENKRVANIIGIRSAARTTTVKPAGTTSLVCGSSSGIHAWHDKFYIRRMRVGKNEAIYKYLVDNHPELVEDEYFRPHDTAVISIPQKAPDGSILRTESPLQLLERVKRVYVEWVKTGHRTGNNTHNISATVSIREHEWASVGEWMWKNREYYNGLSVLPYDGGTYIQAPFETCDEETYNKMMESLTEVDLNKIVELDDNTDLSGELACGADGCEIV
jgi:hypothetical protein